MIKSIFPKIKAPATYEVGLQLARAHRVLKDHTDTVLTPYSITSVDWAILGILYEANEKPCRLIDLSDQLGVEAPFTTKRVEALVKLGYVSVTPDTIDKRVRLSTLTSAGKKIVTTVEPLLRAESRQWLKGTSPTQLYGFLKVIKAICTNSDTK